MPKKTPLNSKKLKDLYNNSKRVQKMKNGLNRNYLNGKLSFVDFDKIKEHSRFNADSPGKAMLMLAAQENNEILK